MKAPDKIYCTELDVAGLYKELYASYCPAESCEEYIRKDALIEWLENKIKIPDVSFINGLTYLAYKDVIEHINEM